MAENGLPEGWTAEAIGNVLDVNPRKPPKDALPPDTPVTFVPMPAVDAQSGAITAPQERPFANVRNGFTSFRDDDVIIAKITPCMENGKAAIARGLVNGLGFGSTEFHVLRPIGCVVPDYVYHFVRQKAFRKEAEANMSGSVGQKRVPANFIKSAELPVAPLAEQKRIVAMVEKLLARVNAARERLAKVPAILKRFRQSVLAAACSGRLTADWRDTHPDIEPAATLLERIHSERRDAAAVGKRGRKTDLLQGAEQQGNLPDKWVWASLSEVLHYTRSAGYGVLQPGPHVPGGVPMVRVCDIEGGTVLVDQLKQIAPEIDTQYRRTRLEGCEVLVTLVGTIGRTAVVPASAKGANIARAVAMLPLCPHVVAEFVRYTLAEPMKNAELVDLAREVARKTLNLGLLKAVVVPLAPLDEQHEIVRRVEALFKLADTIEKRVTAGTQRADRLTQATLAKAFRGELVPTEAELARQEGRDYEPASVLLERIKAERGLVGGKARRLPRKRRKKTGSVS